MFLVAVETPVTAPKIASALLTVEYQVVPELLTNVASLLIGNHITLFYQELNPGITAQVKLLMISSCLFSYYSITPSLLGHFWNFQLQSKEIYQMRPLPNPFTREMSKVNHRLLAFLEFLVRVEGSLMSSGLTVLCHYYNESYMLQWWLKHHYSLFDHGIMIDYGSTDRSNDLIRTFAPTWEIRSSRNQDFDLVGCDQEVMDIERELNGWKMVLNTTEFLCVRDKAELVKQLDMRGLSIYRTTGITMLDPLGNCYPDPDANLPLVKQRHHGIIQMDTFHRDRFIHNHPDGAYEIGRHHSTHTLGQDIYLKDAYTLHFQYSPWNEGMIERKLFIQTRIPRKYRENGLGWQHYVDRPRLEEMYREQAMHTEDLHLNLSCAWIFS